MAKRHSQESFFMLTPKIRDKLLECNLTASEWRIWCYLISLDPFGDRGTKFSPAELMIKCGVSKSTFFAAKAKFQKLGLFDFRDGVTRVINLQARINHSENSDYSQEESLIDSENSDYDSENSDYDSENSDYDSENSDYDSENSDYDSENSDYDSENSDCDSENSDKKTLKPLQNKPSKSPQTIQINKNIQTLQTEEEDFNSEEEEEEKQLTAIADVGLSQILEKPAKKKRKVNKVTTIPQDLINRLEELEIPLDEKVRKAIANHDISQAYGAAAHVEKTWETINNPKSVFFYQISRQKIEKLGPGKIYTADDFREHLTLNDLKHRYPGSWREAASHFGIEIPPEEETTKAEDDEGLAKGLALMAQIKAEVAEKNKERKK